MGEYLLLILIILCLLIALAACLLKFYELRHKFDDLTEILSDIQTEHTNKKLLIKETDMLAPLVFQINHIVYAYEEKLRDLKSAEETNKQLMTSLSHDVRTPLTTLIGYLDAVHSSLVTGKEQDEYVETARQRAYDLKDYIDVLFDWFRLNSNEFTLSIEKVELTELTRNILKDWIPVFLEKSLQYDIEIPEEQVMVKIDPDGYTRVINNLVQNVLAHSHADKIEFIVSVLSQQVMIHIIDNGIGIEKEDLPHIFDRLYKCDKGRSEKGSGLGLAIVYQMVDRMGGSILAQSTPNEQTTFTVTLPLVS